MRTPSTAFILIALSAGSLLAWAAEPRHALIRMAQATVAVSDTPPTDTSRYRPTTEPTYVPEDRPGDPFSSQTSRSPMVPDAPPGTETKVVLDSITGNYIIYEKVGQVDYRPVTSMTFEEYEKWKAEKDRRDYNQAKSQGKENENPLASTSIIPRIYVSPMFDRIFGGNYVDIRPNGSVLLDFGYRRQRVYNPALPIRQQKNGQFLFDQQISLNAQGKIGDKLKVNINQDTKAAFEFDNTIKLDYTGYDHEILQKIEAGNVSLPVSSSLITGAQNLFGLKTTMQFGRLKVVSVVSNQRGRTEKITIKNGAQSRDVSVPINDYEDNQHYFLGHFFRNRYDGVLGSPPVVTSGTNVGNLPGSGLDQTGAGGQTGQQQGAPGGQSQQGYNSGQAQVPASSVNSGIQITRMELYVTNRQNNTTTLRNIAAFQDLGEYKPLRKNRWMNNPLDSSIRPVSNATNTLYATLTNQANAAGVFRANEVGTTLQGLGLVRGEDFEVIRGARKLEEGRDFTLQRQLGYLSLNTKLRDDEVLGMACEYSFNGAVFKVGELQEDYGQRSDSSIIILKMLRPSQVRLDLPTWNLQMKNIYSLKGGSISKENFQLRIVYRDDSSGVDNPALPRGRFIKDKPLVQVFNLDRLNPINELQPDGNFDFIEGVTVDSRYGRIIFPNVEPFGNTLNSKFDQNDPVDLSLAAKYVFRELYKITKADALQAASKAKFFLVGKTQSFVSTEIPLNAFNIARGSVVVTAGSQRLVDGQDYSVDYDAGRLTILNPGILSSGQELEIRFERADMFAFTQRSFFGSRLDYVLNKDVSFGATVLYQNERPVVRRVAVGEEPGKNLMLGFDVNYKSDSRLITRMVDALPLISTKEKSNVTISAEYAHIFPGANKFVDKSKKGISFIDDFENARSPVHTLERPTAWRVASIPNSFYGTRGDTNNLLTYADRRARIAWYMVDATVFYTSQGTNRAKNITSEDLKNNYIRPVGPKEINKGRDLQQINLNEPIFDVVYFPQERGPYNFNPNLNDDGSLKNPRANFGGLMTAFTGQTDFDYSNVEFLEFWMMDPFQPGVNGAVDGDQNVAGRQGGRMIFDLGILSEDVMKDGRQMFENGLPTDANAQGRTTFTGVSRVPNQQIVNRQFENRGRTLQDVGLDGLNNQDEATVFDTTYIRKLPATLNPDVKAAIQADPSNDDFSYYLSDEFDNADAKIIQRYKRYNNQQGNSPEGGGQFTRQSYNTPDNEDINEDNTLNEINSYYSYKVDFEPSRFRVGQNYIVDQIDGENGAKWYQFRIPIKELSHPNALPPTGNIRDFKTIKNLRMYMSGFESPVACRFYKMQLVAPQWRKYPKALNAYGVNVVNEDDADFSVTVVNIEENGAAPDSAGQRKVPYTLPPGAQQRDRDVTSGVNRRLNEQSLSLCVDNLRDGDARAVFKNTIYDFLNYGKVQMFVHAQPNGSTKDNDMEVFIRLGTDFTENYYEVAVPLKMTTYKAGNDYTVDNIWPQDNFINAELSWLTGTKLSRNGASLSFAQPFTQVFGNQKVTVLGNPDLSTVVTIMIGVRNPFSADGFQKGACVWVDEFRMTDYIKNDGWAATGRMTAKLADLGTLNVSGRYITPGFGSLEQKISERSRETKYIYNVSTNLSLDKFFPKNWGLRVPAYVTYEHQNSTPLYDPLNPDIKLKNIPDDPKYRSYKRLVQDNTIRRAVNLTNVQKVKTGQNPKSHFYDVENLSVSWSYSEVRRTNVTIFDYVQRQINYGAGYTFSASPKAIEPFSKIKFLSSPWLKLIKEVNFTPLPNNIAIRFDLVRNFTRQQLRSSDVFSPVLPPGLLTFEKSMLFNRTYGARWAPFKSLTLDYSANAQAVVDEPIGDIKGNRAKQDTVWKNVRDGGRLKVFNQNIRAGYRLPLDKLPLTDWISADVSYTAGMNWSASPLAMQDTIGNVLQNSRDRALNGRFDLLRLYNKVKFLQDANNLQPRPRKSPADKAKEAAAEKKAEAARRAAKNKPKTAKKEAKPKEGADAAKDQKGAPPAKDAVDTAKKPRDLRWLKQIARGLMAVRNVSFQYQLTENTVLPGYRPTPLYAGFSRNGLAPTLPFLLGDQDPNIRFEAVKKGWLGTSTSQNSPFQQAVTENLNFNANIEPAKDFRLRLDVRRTATSNYREIFRDTAAGFNNTSFASLNPNRGGSYTISFLMIRSFHFGKGHLDELRRSEEFVSFEHNLPQVAARLNAANPNSVLNRPGDTASSQYLQRSQDVLIPSFVGAYTGKNGLQVGLTKFPRIPMPNWRLDWSGLSKVPFLAEMFPSITISHGYTSTYSIDNYLSSLRYGVNELQLNRRPDQLSTKGLDTVAGGVRQFAPVYNITTVVMQERFQPLLGINVRTKSKVTIRLDYNRDRSYALNVSNAQITEIRGQDVTFGLGYAKSGVKLPFRTKGRPIVLKNELTIRSDMTIRDNEQIQRKIGEPNQTTNGGVDIQFKPTANYVVNQRLNIQMYFERTINNPRIASSFKRRVTAFGFQLRFALQ